MDVESGEVLANVGTCTTPPTAPRYERRCDSRPAQQRQRAQAPALCRDAGQRDGIACDAFPRRATYYRDFTPHNYNRTFDGAVPADRVVERSLNVPSVRMLDKYGKENFLALVRALGFGTIDRSAPITGFR